MPHKLAECLNDPPCSSWRKVTSRDRCGNCRAEYNRRHLEYHHQNKDRINAQRRARGHFVRHGLTDREKAELFEASDGLCAICYEVPATVIDHDHKTRIVRGALCAKCNKGLGFIEKMDLTSALEYVKSDV